MKECATCLRVLEDDQFYKSPRYRCKPCHLAYVRAWQARNKERVNAANRRYRAKQKSVTSGIAMRLHPRAMESLSDALKQYSDADDNQRLECLFLCAEMASHYKRKAKHDVQ